MNQPAPTNEWPSPPDDLRLAENEVHVWAASLEASSDELAKFIATLSPDEAERAAKFRAGRPRNRYIAGRGLLRAVLGRCLGVAPAALDFVYSPQGKPALGPGANAAGIHFNLAHSEDLALIAVTRAGLVGVDVERIRPIKNAADLVTRFFSARENELFQKLPPSRKPMAFFNLWTRKEALLKATGEGIAGGLNRVEVSFLEGEPARVLAIAGDAEQAARWSLQTLSPTSGFVGAMAVQGGRPALRSWGLWNPSASRAG